jgi:hypothetical protein
VAPKATSTFAMPALPAEADIERCLADVRFVPIADINGRLAVQLAGGADLLPGFGDPLVVGPGTGFFLAALLRSLPTCFAAFFTLAACAGRLH